MRSKLPKALLLLLLISAALRLYGNHWGLPNERRFTTLYVDEYTPLHWLSRMKPRQLDFNPHDFRVPTFFYYQVGVALQVASWFQQVRLTNDSTYYLQHPREYAKLYYVGRTLTALYGIALTALLFFLGRKISDSETGGFLSAGWYTVIPVAVISCHVIDVGVPVSFWLGFSFFCLCTAVQKQNSRWLLVGALAAGLSFSTKYTSAPIFPLVAYTLWKIKARPPIWLAAGSLCALGFLIGTPYSVLDVPQFRADFAGLTNSQVETQVASWRYYWITLSQYRYAVGAVLVALCLWGLARQFFEKKPAAQLAALYLIPYFYLLGKAPSDITRYLNETLPFLLPFGSFVILQLRGKHRWVRAGLLLILSLSQVPYTFAINRSLAHEIDPRDQASDWIVAHLPDKSVIGLEYEANFLTPGHVFMQYWKGRRYAVNLVRPPGYTVVIWDDVNHQWPNPHLRHWIQNNLLYSGLGRKVPAEIARVREERQRMEAGFHPIQVFERKLSWGPFRYGLPAHAGWDWIIFFPTLTVYEKNL